MSLLISQLSSAKGQQLLAQAQQLQKQLNYQDAFPLYEKVMPIFEQAKEWENYVNVLLEGGYCALKTQKPEQAIQYFQMALPKAQEIFGERHLLTAKAYKHLGYYEMNHIRNYPMAEIYYQKALTIEQQLLPSIHLTLAKTHTALVKSYTMQHKPEKSLPHLQQIEQIYQTLHSEVSDIQMATLYTDFGKYYRQQGKIAEAYTAFQKALILLEQSTNSQKDIHICTAYAGIAQLYTSIDKDKAISYHQRALSYYPTSVILLNSLAQHYTKKKKFTLALKYLTQAQQIVAQSFSENHRFFILTHKNIAHCYLLMKNCSQAERHCHIALIPALKNIAHAEYVVTLYNLLGDSCFNQQRYERAKHYYEKSLEMNIKINNTRVGIVATYFLLGRCYFKLQSYKKSWEALQLALQKSILAKEAMPPYYNLNVDLGRCIFNKAVITVYAQKALVFFHYFKEQSQQAKDLQMALFSCQTAFRHAQKMQNSFNQEISKLSLSAETTKVQPQSIKIACYAAQFAQQQPAAFAQATNEIAHINQTSYPKEQFAYAYTAQDCRKLAFSFSEKGKAWTLFDSLRDANAKIQAQLPKNLLEQEQKQQAKLNELTKKIQQTTLKIQTCQDAADKKAYQQQLSQLQTQQFECQRLYERFLQQMEKDYPNYYHIKHQTEPVSIRNIQQQLKMRQALISYSITEQTIYIFVITQHSFHIYEQAKPQEFEAKISKFLKAIQMMRYQKYTSLAYEIYQILLQPIEAQLHAQHIKDLVIIPDRNLNYLPFETLITEAAQGKPNYQHLDYLICAYNIQYHSSATLFCYQNSLPTHQEENVEGFVGFAPVYADEPPNASTNSLSSVVTAAEQSGVAEENGVRSIQIGAQNYLALLYSEEEVKGTQKIFAKSSIKANTFLHEKATIDQFKTAVKNKKYIHIAAHGYETKGKDAMTGIIFSPSQNSQDEEEAILYLSDTYSLQLQADLVVLSSCKSGIGTLAAGEGMMAMNRGFLYAGAQNVLYTLFKVYDKASSELVQQFFRQVIENKKSYSSALQMAKQALIKQKGYTPKHWAGFVLIGK